jgi:hypothetical protein
MGMDAALDGGVLGRQAKGVEPDREEDVVALHAFVAGADVGGRHCIPVADVQVTAGVGEHGQRVVLGLAVVNHGAVELVFFPLFLPFQFDLLGYIRISHVCLLFGFVSGSCCMSWHCLGHSTLYSPLLASATQVRSSGMRVYSFPCVSAPSMIT